MRPPFPLLTTTTTIFPTFFSSPLRTRAMERSRRCTPCDKKRWNVVRRRECKWIQIALLTDKLPLNRKRAANNSSSNRKTKWVRLPADFCTNQRYVRIDGWHIPFDRVHLNNGTQTTCTKHKRSQSVSSAVAARMLVFFLSSFSYI